METTTNAPHMDSITLNGQVISWEDYQKSIKEEKEESNGMDPTR